MSGVQRHRGLFERAIAHVREEVPLREAEHRELMDRDKQRGVHRDEVPSVPVVRQRVRDHRVEIASDEAQLVAIGVARAGLECDMGNSTLERVPEQSDTIVVDRHIQ